MTEILIFEHDGRQAVSARELYDMLGFENKNFSRWAKKNITENEFAMEGEDWLKLNDDGVYVLKTKTKEAGGRPTEDYALSIDFAKRISMLARTEKGEEIRRYFVTMEQEAVTGRLKAIEALVSPDLIQRLMKQDDEVVKIPAMAEALKKAMKDIERINDKIYANRETHPNAFDKALVTVDQWLMDKQYYLDKDDRARLEYNTLAFSSDSKRAGEWFPHISPDLYKQLPGRYHPEAILRCYQLIKWPKGQ